MLPSRRAGKRWLTALYSKAYLGESQRLLQGKTAALGLCWGDKCLRKVTAGQSSSDSLPRTEGSWVAPQTQEHCFCGSWVWRTYFLLTLLESKCHKTTCMLGATVHRKVQQRPCFRTSLVNRASHKDTLSQSSSSVQGVTSSQHTLDMTTIYKLVSHTPCFSMSSKRAENKYLSHLGFPST